MPFLCPLRLLASIWTWLHTDTLSEGTDQAATGRQRRVAGGGWGGIDYYTIYGM